MKAFLDYAYTPLGEDKDNALSFDIYAPEDSTRDENLPVVVYVHGGAWTGGDKVAVHLKRGLFHGFGESVQPMVGILGGFF